MTGDQQERCEGLPAFVRSGLAVLTWLFGMAAYITALVGVAMGSTPLSIVGGALMSIPIMLSAKYVWRITGEG